METASFALLDLVMDRRFALLASPALWLEVEAVLKRPEIAKIHRLNRRDIDDALNALCAEVQPVKAYYLWRPQLRDPNDEMVLEAPSMVVRRTWSPSTCEILIHHCNAIGNQLLGARVRALVHRRIF